MSWPADFNALVYASLSGNGTVGEKRRPVHTGQLTVFGAGDTLDRRGSRHAGRSIPLFSMCSSSAVDRSASRSPWRGPFVMNTDDEIRQAYEDFEAGRLGTIPR